jgi:hypothetical protein
VRSVFAPRARPKNYQIDARCAPAPLSIEAR